jgi:hypothetical protein
MRKPECKTKRRPLDGSVFSENVLERRWVERLVRPNSGLQLRSGGERTLQCEPAVCGHIAPKAHDVSQRRVPEEESGRDCSAWLVDRHKVAGDIVCKLGLHMQLHYIEICQHVVIRW